MERLNSIARGLVRLVANMGKEQPLPPTRERMEAALQDILARKLGDNGFYTIWTRTAVLPTEPVYLPLFVKLGAARGRVVLEYQFAVSIEEYEGREAIVVNPDGSIDYLEARGYLVASEFAPMRDDEKIDNRLGFWINRLREEKLIPRN